MSNGLKNITLILSSLLFLIVLSLAALFTFRSIQQEKEITLKNTEEQTMLSALIMGQRFTEIINTVDLFHIYILNKLAAKKPVPPDYYIGLQQDLSFAPQIARFFIINMQGDQLWSSWGSSPEDEVLLKKIAGNYSKQVIEFDIENQEDHDTSYFVMSRRSKELGSTSICVSFINFDFFTSFSSSLYRAFSNIQIVSDTGKILSSWAAPGEEDFNLSDYIDLEKGLSGGTLSYSTDNVGTLYQIPEYPYYLLINLDLKQKLRDWDGSLLRNAVLFVFIFLACLLVYLLIYRMQKQEQVLQKQYTQQLEDQVNERTEDLQKVLGERETLLKEIHHRIKNNLALVSSIIQLQSMEKGFIDETGVKDLITRIDSILMIHGKLYKSDNFNKINLEEYLSELVQAILDSFSTGEITFIKNIDSFLCPSEIMVPLGLIASEITTNAIKHGLHSSGTYEILGKKNGATYQLSFINDGEKLPDNFSLDGHQSLGLELLLVLTAQIQGEMRASNNPKTCFILEFPMASLNA